MKSFKLLVAGAFVLALLTPVLAVRMAGAQTQLPEWGCYIQDGEFSFITTEGCDLALQKEVSVNGGAFFDADTSGEAVNATIGDSVVYRISITDTSTIYRDYYVGGAVQVYDVLPVGVTFGSYSTSDGSTYDQSIGTWQFILSSGTVYPLTLTVNTTAAATGLTENMAFLAGNYCDGWCEYSDSNSENNADSAWINVSAAPVVLAESTPVVLAATGSGAAESLVAGGLILATLGTLGYNRFARKNS